MNKKVFSIVNLLLYIGVITINALANILPINNLNTGELSDNYPNLFVPAALTFSIWGVIYALLLLLSIYNVYIAFRDDKRNLNKFNFLLALNYILNILWILSWHYEYLFVSWIIMLLLFTTLLLMDNFLNKKIIHTLKDKVAFRLTISVYFGWISVATIANTTALLVNSGWDGFGLSHSFWAITLIITGGILGILTLLIKKNIPYALVIAWAYIGIIIKRGNSIPKYQNIINVTYIITGILILLSIYTFIKTRPKKVVL